MKGTDNAVRRQFASVCFVNSEVVWVPVSLIGERST